MAVIAPAGLSDASSCERAGVQVQLLIDRNAAAGALVERSRAQGWSRHRGRAASDELRLGVADVKVGDRW